MLSRLRTDFRLFFFSDKESVLISKSIYFEHFQKVLIASKTSIMKAFFFLRELLICHTLTSRVKKDEVKLKRIPVIEANSRYTFLIEYNHEYAIS